MSVRRRVGCRILATPVPCRCCGAMMDVYLEHAETCALAEATKGHYKAVRAVERGLAVADPRIQSEVEGLLPNSDRPADLLTSVAAPGGEAALDITITSPNRGDAGADPPASAYARKMKRYRRAIPILAEQGIRLRPMCWSADGRPRPAVIRTMKYAAAAAARQKPGLDPIGFVRRWASDIATAIQSRRACMSLAVLPKACNSEEWLISGDR